MTTIDLSDPQARADAVRDGYIWSAPRGAVIAALKDIASGRIPPPSHVPQEYAELAAEYGVTVAMAGGLAEGSGPA